MNIFESVCLLLCGVGVFLTGMKLMGDGLSKGSAKSIRSLFNKISNNTYASYGLGVGTTAIVQSSAATTVMSMGLVSAGIMSQLQSTAFVLGARLGTTITGILVSLSSISITPLLMALAFVGICLILFVSKESVKAVGYILSGLGVLFAGMNIMTSAITGQEQVSSFFIELFNAIDFPLLLVVVGAVFTAIIQSSSATTGLLITLMNAGTLQTSQAVFILIGATIGTCITSVLASIGSETKARRVALFNVLTAVIGAIVIGGIVWILKAVGVLNKILSVIPEEQKQWQLSLFGVVYSFLAGAICFPFIRPLNSLVDKMVREKKKKEEFSCFFIKETSLKTPAVALLQVQKEVENLALLASDNLSLGFKVVLSQSEEMKKRIEKEEERIDFITKRISEFLVQLATKNIAYSDELAIGSMHHVIDDIERIGDHGIGFMKMGLKMRDEGVSFSEDAKKELEEMFERVQDLYDVSLRVFKSKDQILLSKVDGCEKVVDVRKKTLANKHVERLNNGACSIETGTYFYSAIASLERVGDHLENVAYSVRSITGSVSE